MKYHKKKKDYFLHYRTQYVMLEWQKLCIRNWDPFESPKFNSNTVLSNSAAWKRHFCITRIDEKFLKKHPVA